MAAAEAAPAIPPVDPDERLPPLAKKDLPLRHALAHMARYLRTPAGRHAVRLQIEAWKQQAWEAHRARHQPACSEPDLLAAFFLARQEAAGIPEAGLQGPRLRVLSELPGMLAIHDPDGIERLQWEAVPELLADLDLPLHLPGISTKSIRPHGTTAEAGEGERPSNALSVRTEELYRILRMCLTSGIPLVQRKRLQPDRHIRTERGWWHDRARRSFFARARAALRMSALGRAVDGGRYGERDERERLDSVRLHAERDLLRHDVHDSTRQLADRLLSSPEARLRVRALVEQLRRLRRLYGRVGRGVGEARGWWRVSYCFCLLDPERTGAIDDWQLPHLLASLGLWLHPRDQVHLLRRRLDPSGHGHVALADFRAWYTAEAAAHRKTLPSRLLQLRRGLQELAGLHVQGDALYSLRMEALRDARRRVSCLFAVDDGDRHALLGIRPWHRRPAVRYEHDLDSLLHVEAASAADVVLMVQHTEVGACMADDHLHRLRGRRRRWASSLSITAGPLQPLIWLYRHLRRPTAQHEERLARHCDEVLGPESSMGLGERHWLDQAGRRVRLPRLLGRRAWSQEAISEALASQQEDTDHGEEVGPGLAALQRAKQATVPAKSRLARVGWWLRIRATRLGRLWRGDHLLDMHARSRELYHEVARLVPSAGGGDEGRAAMDVRVRVMALAQVHADHKLRLYLGSFRRQREARAVEERVGEQWGTDQMLEPGLHAFRLLELHRSAVSAYDLPLVVRFIYGGESDEARALLRWVTAQVGQCRLQGQPLTVPLLRTLCELAPGRRVVPCSKWVEEQQSPARFALLLLQLRFRDQARAAVEQAADGHRLAQEVFFHAPTFSALATGGS